MLSSDVAKPHDVTITFAFRVSQLSSLVICCTSFVGDKVQTTHHFDEDFSKTEIITRFDYE